MAYGCRALRLQLLCGIVMLLLAQTSLGAPAEPSRVCTTGDAVRLRIEYAIDDQYRANGYRKQGAPVSVRGDEKRVLVFEGDASWERVTGTSWNPDADAKRRTAEMKRMLNEIEGEPTPAQRLRLYSLMNAPRKKVGKVEPTDTIRVEVPPPGWSFSYDAITRLGSKYVKTPALTRHERLGLAAIPVLRGQLRQLQERSDITSEGRRQIAGYDCEMTVVTKPVRLEYCVANIRGYTVDLFLRMGQPDDFVRIETAVSVDEDPCVHKGTFDLPGEVELIERP